MLRLTRLVKGSATSIRPIHSSASLLASPHQHKGDRTPTSNKVLSPFGSSIPRPNHKVKYEPPTIPPDLPAKSYNRDDEIPSSIINGLPVYPTPPMPSLADPNQALPMKFADFGLEEGLVQSLQALYGKEGTTSPIETLAFRHFTSSSSGAQVVLMGAETGSGKTISYLIPLFHHLKATDDKSTATEGNYDALYPRALVLSPTHELTRQSTQFAKCLTHNTKLSVLGLSSTATGGVGARRGTVDVCLGTAGSVRRAMGLRSDTDTEAADDGDDSMDPRGAMVRGLKRSDRGVVKGKDVEWVVIDETDVLLGPEFYEETVKILSELPKNVKIILTTATLPPFLINLLHEHPYFSSSEITHLLSPGLHKLPEKLSTRFIKPSSTGNQYSDLTHQVRLTLANDTKNAKPGDEPSKIVIFANTDVMVERLAMVLGTKKLDALAWTGSGEERLRGKNGALDDFLLRPALPKASDMAGDKKTIASAEETAGEASEEAVAEWEEEPLPSTPNHDDPIRPATVYPEGVTPKRRVLVTTSLLSRGLDFRPSVSSVFLYQPPRDVLDFVHRAGRAGRAGRVGRVVVFGLGDGKTLEGFLPSKPGKNGWLRVLQKERDSQVRKMGKKGKGYGWLSENLRDVLGETEVVRSRETNQSRRPDSENPDEGQNRWESRGQKPGESKNRWEGRGQRPWESRGQRSGADRNRRESGNSGEARKGRGDEARNGSGGEARKSWGRLH